MNVGVLRNYRAQEEDRLQAECMELLRALERSQETRARLEADEARQSQAFLTREAAGIAPDDAALTLVALDALSALITKTKEEEAALRQAVERKRSEVLEASRERRKLELLEERRQREQRAAEDRKAQQLMDEIAARRAPKDKGVV